MSRIMTVGALAFLVLPGCSDRADWVGEWVGERPFTTPTGQDPVIGRSLATVTLIIKKDGRFELTEETFGKTGSAVLGANTGTLLIDTVLGRRPGSLGPNGEKMAGERRIKMRQDGTILFERPDSEPVVLKRGPQSLQTTQPGAQ